MFANKVVLLTGGSAGIGAVTIEMFAKEGASVAFVGRNEARLKEVAARCEKLGVTALAIKADISIDEEAENIIKKTVNKFGKIDILVNNAAIVPLHKIDQPNLLATFDRALNTNLRPVINLINLAVPYLKETKGNIVNISSIAATNTRIPGAVSYSVCKAAMDQFTRYAAVELGPFGIRVNTVSPGAVLTDVLNTLPSDLVSAESLAAMTALGKPAQSDEVGDLILFVASDKAKSITGSLLVIDNGTLVK